MKSLKGLTFSTVPDPSKNPTLGRRIQLLKKLEEQRALALDPSHTRTVSRRVKAEDGSSKVLHEAKVIRPWWKENPSGGLFLFVRFGGRYLEFEKGKAAISLARREELASAIDSLIAATRAGELDALISQQAGRTSRAAVRGPAERSITAKGSR